MLDTGVGGVRGGRGAGMPVQRQTPPKAPHSQWKRAFMAEEEGYMQKQYNRL